ncbi:protein-L-isoaspartate O-methyltransferase [Rhodobacteraceae bacterium WD3A24]|nr:protein-L-isoaspartate O-methyltransferase [Rhodobacteraceae bacterium WD3A24]
MTDFAARRTMMVDTQVRPADVTKFPIIDAMLRIPREAYVPDELREVAYAGENLHLGADRVMLDPRTLAKMLDTLDIRSNELVLDIGAAMGYSAAVISRLAEAVVALEEDSDLAAEAQARLAAQEVDNVAVVNGPLAGGAPRHGPYDVIVVEGGVEAVPDAITDQLREGGRIGCVFMEGVLGVVRIGYKLDGHIDWRDAFNAGAPVLDGFARAPSFAL